MQPSRSFTIRPAVEERDFGAISAIMTEVLSYAVSETTLHEWEARRWEGLIRHRLVAEDGSRIVGYASSAHQSWDPPGRLELWVAVSKTDRRPGIGSSLYDAALACALNNGATVLTGEVREGDTESLRFAEARGYRLDRHLFESQLDVAEFDETPFAAVIPRLEAEGIRFFSLADRDTPEIRRGLHEVNAATALDIPGYEGVFSTFDEFSQMVFASSWYIPEGQIMAAEGDRIVGLAAIAYYPEQELMINNMTGVLPQYRGRKIALALKLLAIGLAQRKGVRHIRTDNDSANAPMLAINRKLGYRAEAGLLRLKRAI